MILSQLWRVMTGFDPDLMLPDEDVYKPKKKETTQKTNGLENFMESDD